MNALVERRKKLGITQEQVAADIGVSTVAYHMYETGKRRIPEDKKGKICEVLKLTKKEQAEIFLASTFALRKTTQK